MEDFEGNGLRRRVQRKIVRVEPAIPSRDDLVSSKTYFQKLDDEKSEFVSNLANKAIEKANSEVGPLSKMKKLHSFLSFLADEGSPLVILLMLFDTTFGEPGPGIPLLINVTASIYVAYIMCTEKYSSTEVQPTGKFFAWETAKKAVSLMFNWFNWGRTEKRKEKLANIQLETNGLQLRHCYNKFPAEVLDYSAKFYESELRYTREDREMLYYRSFPLALYYAYVLVHPDNLALPLCELKDVKKLIFILFTIVKASFIFKTFNDTKELDITIRELQHSTISHPPGRQADARQTFVYAVSVLLHLVQICIRFLSTMLLLISKSYSGLIIHFVVASIEDYLKETVFWSRLDKNGTKLRIIFPEGVKKNLWVYFYKSSKVFKYMAKWTSLYTIPSTLFFLFSHTAFTRTESNSSVICSTSSRKDSNVSHHGTLDIVTNLWNVTEWQLGSDPINAIDLIGGMDMGAILVLVLLLLSFCLEGLHKYIMQSCEYAKYIKSCENKHAFSCMFEKLQDKLNQNVDDTEAARRVTNDTFLFRFMGLLLLEDSDFEEGSNFSRLKESTFCHSKYHESVKYRRGVPGNLDKNNPEKAYLLNLAVALELMVHKVSKKDSETLKRFVQHQMEFERRPNGRTYWPNGIIEKEEENYALSVLNELQENDRFVEGPKHKNYLLTQIFKSILCQRNESVKCRDLNLFAFFVDIFEYQMCQISSTRLEATLRQLEQAI